ncbi:hypothetical protein Tco_0556719, partial [Tanacetum coccineum]
IIMAQQQHAADVHPDELCPPNKRYDLMHANKKDDLEHVQCPSESKILMNIIKNHPLRFSIAASASVPWIYMAQFWHTLKEDGSKHRLKFLLDRKELTLTLDDFRTIFHLPQANDNNHASFVPPPSFSDMVPFYKQVLGFTMELKTVSNFKISGLLQPWQTLCKIFSKCLTTRVMRWDQPPLQIIRARDAYHNLQDDDIMKNIFNSGRNKNKVGMRIPAWMITDEMKLTEHYKMYTKTDSVKSAVHKSLMNKKQEENYWHWLEPRSDKESPEVEIVQEKEEETTKDTKVEPDKDTPMVDVTNIVPPVNVDDEEDEITDEVFELRRRVKGKNVEETRISPIPSPTRSPRNLSTLVSSDTEKLQELTVTHPTPSSGSSEPKLTKTNRLLSLIKAKPNRFKRYKSFFHELQGRYGYLFAHLKKRFMPRTSSDQLADNLHDVMMETLPSLVKEKVTEQVKKEVPAQVRRINYMSGHILHVHPAQVQSSSVPEQQHQLYLAMKADPLSSAVRTRDQDDPYDDAHLEGENSAKRQKTSEYEAYVSGESSSGQVNVEEPGPSTSGNQEQMLNFDFHSTDFSYVLMMMEIPTSQRNPRQSGRGIFDK